MTSSPSPSVTVTSVKGHLVTKSSALATDHCKLEKQFLTAQHMAAHYKKVINAKPTIDTTPPKSMIKSQRARDRAKREMVRYSAANESVERARSANSNKNFQLAEENESPLLRNFNPRATKSAHEANFKFHVKSEKPEEVKPRILPNQEKLNKSMSNLMNNFTHNNKNRVFLYKPTNGSSEFDSNRNTPAFNSSMSRQNLDTQENARNALTTLLFNVRSSNEDPAVQRGLHPALKAMSRLVSGRNYDVMEIHANKFSKPEKEFEPRIINTGFSSSLRESGCYQPPRRKKKSSANSTSRNKDIDSSRTEDNNNDQMGKKIFNNTSRHNLVSSDQEDEENFKNKSHFSRSFNDKSNTSIALNNSSNHLNLSNRASKSPLKTAADKEEDIKYLEFVKEVTDDIVARGICSNRVINNCFEFHLKKHKNDLNEAKMRELLNTLRKDIGIPNEDDGNMDVNSSYHQTINKALSLDKERTNDKKSLNTSQSDVDYLTLRMFGWSSNDQNQTENQNELTELTNNKNVWKTTESRRGSKEKSSSSSRRNSNHSNENLNLFDTYENQIVKNIKSIRKTSNQKTNEKEKNDDVELLNSSTNANNDKPLDSSKISSKKQQNSILKKSQQVQESFDKSPEPTNKKQNSFFDSNKEELSLSKLNNNNNNDDIDDDEDVFTGRIDYESTLFSKNRNDSNEISRKNSNGFENKPQINQKQKINSQNSENSDDLFNDDYGTADKSDQEDDQENFENLLKSKRNKKIQKKSENSEEAEGEQEEFDENSKRSDDESSRPKPAPRKMNNIFKKGSSSSDEEF